MSPLTKLFVGLLVVFSLLQTAAVVVYVNKEDAQRNALKQTQDRLMAAESESQAAKEALTAAQANSTAMQNQLNDQLARTSEALTNAQKQVGSLNVELAKSSSQAAAQQLDINRLTEALTTSQTTTSKMNDEVARLRTGNDTLVKQSSELNARVSDLTNRLDVTEKERQFLAEQLTEAKGQAQKLGDALKGLGVTPNTANANASRVGPPISGVIRDVRDIAGRKYATISVGSADQVASGMEFKVLTRNGDFLGRLIVQSVEPNESTGYLEGPRIAEIQRGVEVRTQLSLAQ